MSYTIVREAIERISNAYGAIPPVIDAYYRKDKMIIVCEGNQKFWYNFATKTACKSFAK